MPSAQAPQPHRPNQDLPEECEPPEMPVEPDEGLILPLIPDDPELERLGASVAMRPEQGPRRAKAPLSAPGLALPHERDESPDPAPAVPDPLIAQAMRDIDAGMVDTDMHATPGQDAKLRARLVPGPGGKRPSGY